MADIREFCDEIGYELDQNYVDFLLEANGGLVKDDVTFRFRKRQLMLESFDELVPDSASGLRRQYYHFRNEGHCSVNPLLPIAGVRWDSSVCIDLKTQEIRLIFDKELKSRLVIKPNQVIARNFGEFMQSLTVTPRPRDIVAELGEGTPADLHAYLATPGTSINDRSRNKLSIAEEAAKNGNLLVLQVCLDKGADMKGAIYSAVMNNSLDTVKLLVEAGVSPNEPTERGSLPIEAAVGLKGQAIREYLEQFTSDRQGPTSKRNPRVARSFEIQSDYMTANATIYGNQRRKVSAKLLKSISGISDVSTDGSLIRRPAFFKIRVGEEPLRLNCIFDREKIQTHAAGMHGWVNQMHAANPFDNVEVFHNFIDEINQMYGIVAESEFGLQSPIWKTLLEIARPIEGVIFIHNTFVDCTGRILFGYLANLADGM